MEKGGRRRQKQCLEDPEASQNQQDGRHCDGLVGEVFPLQVLRLLGGRRQGELNGLGGGLHCGLPFFAFESGYASTHSQVP